MVLFLLLACAGDAWCLYWLVLMLDGAGAGSGWWGMGLLLAGASVGWCWCGMVLILVQDEAGGGSFWL